MGTRFAAILAVMMVAGCGGYGAEVYQCGTGHECTAGATCEATGFCSLPDEDCGPGGRKYTDHSGDLSGTCVGGGLPIDAGPDVGPPIDARLCFGNAPYTICLAAAPTAPLMLSTATPLNTDTSNQCVETTSGGTGYCVLAGTTISFTGEGSWRATGTKPLVLIASDSITVSAVIDVSSHHTANPATTPEAGAGADPTCAAAATAPSNGGGGAGGSFTGGGGPGAASARGGSAGGTAAPAATVMGLRGGCPGQDGEGPGTDEGTGGHGGGAVLLLAANTINVTGGINAGGQGGRPGTQNTSGGGGGGAGGMIVLDAQTVMSSGLLAANGGAGGEGSGENTGGTAGSDSSGIGAATGGTSGAALLNGGDGGNGSAGAAAGAGAPGSVGTTVNNLRGGGGGGGGGAGLIKAPVGALLGTQISPLVTTP
jgi:hypothetical protein